MAALHRRVRRYQERHDGDARHRLQRDPELTAYSSARLTATIGALLSRAVEAGEIRADVNADDMPPRPDRHVHAA